MAFELLSEITEPKEPLPAPKSPIAPAPGVVLRLGPGCGPNPPLPAPTLGNLSLLPPPPPALPTGEPDIQDVTPKPPLPPIDAAVLPAPPGPSGVAFSPAPPAPPPPAPWLLEPAGLPAVPPGFP